MFFSSKAFAPPVPHLSNKLKEVSETVSEEPDEYKREFIPLDDDGNVDHTSPKYKMNSLLNKLIKEKSFDQMAKDEINKNENQLYDENKQMTVKEIKEILAEYSYSSAYHSFSPEFQDYMKSIELKGDDEFKLFNQKKEDVYYPDNEFVYNICSGLINLDEVNELRDNK